MKRSPFTVDPFAELEERVLLDADPGGTVLLQQQDVRINVYDAFDLTEEEVRASVESQMPSPTVQSVVESLQAQLNALNASAEMKSVTPSFVITARRNDTGNLAVSFGDMPAGLAVQFGSVRVPLQAGNSTAVIPLASLNHSDRRVYTTKIVRQTNGEVLADNLGGFGVANGNHTYSGYSYDPAAETPAVTSLAYTVPVLSAQALAQKTKLEAQMLALAGPTPVVLASEALTNIRSTLQMLEASAEMIQVSPSFSITAMRNDARNLRVGYGNMPAGIAVKFGSQIINLQPGNGSVLIPLASFTHEDRRVYFTQLIRTATGQVAQDGLGGFGIANGYHTYSGYSYDPAAEFSSLPALAHSIPGPLSPAQQLQKEVLTGTIALLEEVLQDYQTRVQQAVDEAFTVIDAEEQRIDAEALSLASSLLPTLLEEAEPVPYARMLVNAEVQGYNLIFTVRYRNPGDRTHFRMIAQRGDQGITVPSQTVEHQGGQTDGTWTYRFDLSSLAINGRIELEQWSDEARTQMLDRVEAWYNPDTRTVQIATGQPAWDALEAGRGVESPIESSLSVLRIDGPSVVVVVTSPGDQSVVAFDTPNLLASQALTHAGGTAFSMGLVTFDVSRQTGEYTLSLYERKAGRVLDTVQVFWDAGAQHLSLMNGSDAWSATRDGQDPLSTEAGAAFTRLLSLSTATLNDTHMNWVQQQSLLAATAGLGTLDFTVSGDAMHEMIFTAHPFYRPQNWEAGIDAEWDRIGRTYQRGIAETNFHNSRLASTNEYIRRFGVRENAMGELMQQAVNVFIRARRGEDERPLLEALDAALARWNQNQDIVSVRNLGAGLPSRGALMASAKIVFDAQWGAMINRQTDVAVYQQWQAQQEEIQQEKGMRKDAEGNWVAVTPDASLLPSWFTAGDIERATNTLTTMLQDPDFAEFSYEELARMAVNMVTAVAEGVTTEQDVLGVRTVIEIKQQEGTDAAWRRVRAAVKLLKPEDTLAFLHSLFRDEGRLSMNIEGRTVHADTHAGHIFLGLWTILRVLYGSDKEVFMQTCAAAEEILGIPAMSFARIMRTSDSKVFADSLFRLFNDHGYNIEQDVSGRELAVNLQYMQTGIRVHFNPSTAKPIDHVWVNMWHPELQNKLIKEKVGIGGKGRLFVDVPYSQIQGVAGINLKTVVWGDGVNDPTPSFNEDTRIDWKKVPLGTLPVAITGEYSTHPDPEIRRKENHVMSVLKDHFFLREPALTNWYMYVASSAHAKQGYNAIDLNLFSQDQGKPVVAPVKGEIVAGGTGADKWHTVTLKHVTKDANGSDVIWYTQYLHMEQVGKRMPDGSIRSFQIGDILEEDEEIGKIGDAGAKPGSYHMHFEANFTGTWGPSINMANFIGGLDIEVKGEAIKVVPYMNAKGVQDYMFVQNGPTATVTWSNELDSWVTAIKNQEGKWQAGGDMLVLDRREQKTSSLGNTYWVAWEKNATIDQMKRVIKKPVKWRDEYNIIQNKEMWVDESNPSSLWNSKEQKFFTVQLV